MEKATAAITCYGLSCCCAAAAEITVLHFPEITAAAVTTSGSSCCCCAAVAMETTAVVSSKEGSKTLPFSFSDSNITPSSVSFSRMFSRSSFLRDRPSVPVLLLLPAHLFLSLLFFFSSDTILIYHINSVFVLDQTSLHKFPPHLFNVLSKFFGYTLIVYAIPPCFVIFIPFMHKLYKKDRLSLYGRNYHTPFTGHTD